jgi:hypothetical protein
MDTLFKTERQKTIEDLQTFLRWIQSVDCKEEQFDYVTKYGHLNRSLDETLEMTIELLSNGESY